MAATTQSVTAHESEQVARANASKNPDRGPLLRSSR